MGRAIGFGMVLVIFAVLLPDVYRALGLFLHTFLSLATTFLNNVSTL